MTDVVVVFIGLAASTLFGISAWVAVIVFRKARRGQDVVPPSYPFGGNLLGGGSPGCSDTSGWLDGGDSGSGAGGGN